MIVVVLLLFLSTVCFVLAMFALQHFTTLQTLLDSIKYIMVPMTQPFPTNLNSLPNTLPMSERTIHFDLQ
jgi:hypothetical protein